MFPVKWYGKNIIYPTKGVKKITSVHDIRVILKTHSHHLDHRIYHETPFFDEIADWEKSTEKSDILMHQGTKQNWIFMWFLRVMYANLLNL